MPKGRVEYLKRLLPYLRNQSEDCLYLNIYAPAQGKESP
jgi:neuroligin